MVATMARQPKAKAEAFGQTKNERFQLLFTAEGLERLDEMVQAMGYSRSDFVERIVRALYNTAPELRDAFLSRAMEDDRNV